MKLVLFSNLLCYKSVICCSDYVLSHGCVFVLSSLKCLQFLMCSLFALLYSRFIALVLFVVYCLALFSRNTCKKVFVQYNPVAHKLSFTSIIFLYVHEV